MKGVKAIRYHSCDLQACEDYAIRKIEEHESLCNSLKKEYEAKELYQNDQILEKLGKFVRIKGRFPNNFASEACR